jgi:nitroreductase
MLKRIIRDLVDRLDRVLLPAAASGGLIASAYYLLASRQFRREHRAVLAGRLAYYRGLEQSLHSSPLLRRNVHRLEKGLVMQPRAPVFAEDYIEETVAEFARLHATEALDAAERKWAADVLADYFAAVIDTPRIARARAVFAAVPKSAADGNGARSVPQPRATWPEASVSYEQFMDLCRRRRSVRWFEQRPVPQALVVQAVAAAAQAPSACNRQPFLFRYFEDAAAARHVAGLAMGTAGYGDNIPALVVVLADLSCYPEERDRHVAYIDAALASMQFMLALETLGLASCPINWPDIEQRERLMARELDLPWHVRPVMLLAIGYADPAGGVPYSAKKPAEALLRERNDYRP